MIVCSCGVKVCFLLYVFYSGELEEWPCGHWLPGEGNVFMKWNELLWTMCVGELGVGGASNVGSCGEWSLTFPCIRRSPVGIMQSLPKPWILVTWLGYFTVYFVTHVCIQSNNSPGFGKWLWKCENCCTRRLKGIDVSQSILLLLQCSSIHCWNCCCYPELLHKGLCDWLWCRCCCCCRCGHKNGMISTSRHLSYL